MVIEELCPSCHGQGWFWLDHEEGTPCTACKGRGIIYRNMEAEAEREELRKLVKEFMVDYKDGLDYLKDR